MVDLSSEAGWQAMGYDKYYFHSPASWRRIAGEYTNSGLHRHLLLHFCVKKLSHVEARKGEKGVGGMIFHVADL